MLVHIGNADAIERKIVGDSVVFEPLEGERVTTFNLAEGLDRGEAIAVVLSGLGQMMNPTARPWWIKCDDDVIRDLLLDHYGLAPDNARPIEWGDGTTTMKEQRS